MRACEVCGAPATVELSGKAKRLSWLKLAFNGAKGARRASIGERIMDLVQEPEHQRCSDHTLCGYCGLTTACLVGCEICASPVCIACSLPALQTDAAGRIIPESADGRVLCASCNPPTGGTNAGIYRPAPTAPVLAH